MEVSACQSFRLIHAMSSPSLNGSNVPGRALVTLSFDDGWRSVYDNAFPTLKRSGFKATHYIVSGYLDSFQLPLYMNVEHIRELYLAGHEIGCHTVSHRHLPLEPVALIESEVDRSKSYLMQLGFAVSTFAYPFGEYDVRVIGQVRRSGFVAARSTIEGLNDASTDPMLLRTRAVRVDTKLSEVTEWLESAVREKQWLILMFHQIDEEGREWSARPSMLEGIVERISRHDIRVVTVSEAARQLYGV